MKSLLFCCTVLGMSLYAIPGYCCYGTKTEEFSDVEQQGANEQVSEALAFLNKRGLGYCLEEKYEAALEDFSYVINNSWDVDPKMFGVALWGKAICDACLRNVDETLQNVEILEMMLEACCQECSEEKIRGLPKTHPSLFNSSFYWDSETINPMIQTVSSSDNLFANPDEVLSPSDCCERIRIFTEKVRRLIKRDFNQRASTPDNNYALDKFWSFIRKVSRKGEDCCWSRTHWTICCTPIAIIWREWNEKGLPRNPPNN